MKHNWDLTWFQQPSMEIWPSNMAMECNGTFPTYIHVFSHWHLYLICPMAMFTDFCQATQTSGWCWVGELLCSNLVGCAGSARVRIGDLVWDALGSVPLAVLVKTSVGLEVFLYQTQDLVLVVRDLTKTSRAETFFSSLVWRCSKDQVRACLILTQNPISYRGVSWFINVRFCIIGHKERCMSHSLRQTHLVVAAEGWDLTERIDVRSLWFPATLWRNPNVPCRPTGAWNLNLKGKCTHWVKLVERVLAVFGEYCQLENPQTSLDDQRKFSGRNFRVTDF